MEDSSLFSKMAYEGSGTKEDHSDNNNNRNNTRSSSNKNNTNDNNTRSLKASQPCIYFKHSLLGSPVPLDNKGTLFHDVQL